MTFLKNFYASYKRNEVGKEVAHIILFVVSVTFSVNLFWHLSSFIVWSILWAALAVVFEYMKVQSFMYAKYYFRLVSWRRLSSLFIAIIIFSMYLAMAVISGLATWGFAKVSIAQQSSIVSQTNIKSDLSKDRLEVIDDELAILQEAMETANEEKKKMNSYAGSYQTGQSMMTEDILEISNRRNELLDKRSQIALELSEEAEGIEIKADDIFTLIGNTPRIDMDGETVKFLLFLAIVVLLEVVLCLTSGEVGTKTTMDTMRYENLKRYITALFNTTANRLNSDKKIVEMTGMQLGDCKKYRKYLTSKSFGGTPLITYGRGYSKSEFTKDELLSIIKSI